jgi:GTP-binding protein HflX
MKENRSLDDLRNTWMANQAARNTVFISAKTRDNIEELRQMLYVEVRKIHALRYPYNNFLYKSQ